METGFKAYFLIKLWMEQAISRFPWAVILKILAEAVEKGYFFPKSAQLNLCRVLKQNVGLKFIRLNGKWILYSHSEKEKAMKAMLEEEKLNYLSERRLASIRNEFYGRNSG